MLPDSFLFFILIPWQNSKLDFLFADVSIVRDKALHIAVRGLSPIKEIGLLAKFVQLCTPSRYIAIKFSGSNGATNFTTICSHNNWLYIQPVRNAALG